MGMRQRVDRAVRELAAAMTVLSEAMSDPSTALFDDVAAGIEELERVMAGKARIDAAFAWLADEHGAGKLVGSSNTVDYLTTTLGISRREALARLRTGASLYSPPPPPPAPAPDEPEESEEERRAREKADAERAERERRQQAESRRKAAEATAEILRIIDRELADLSDAADPGRATLHHRALTESTTRTPEDLRDWLRRQVHLANQAGTPDLLAGYRRRHLIIGEPDADGSCAIRGRLPAADAAMLKAALAPGLRPGAHLDDGAEDTRTRAQRRVDQLSAILNRHLASSQTAARHGVGSVVFSVTAEDIDTLSASSTFVTNTGDRLTPLDLLRLGAAQYDVMVLHDTDGQPLALGRGQRLASMFQKIALFAVQGVCGCPDCTTAAAHTDVHHLTPWIRGGTTDINNLTLVCPPHHADNDDTRTHAGDKGYLDRCPVTGRVGRRAGPGRPLRFNTTQAADDAAGNRIRRRRRPPDDRDEAA